MHLLAAHAAGRAAGRGGATSSAPPLARTSSAARRHATTQAKVGVRIILAGNARSHTNMELCISGSAEPLDVQLISESTSRLAASPKYTCAVFEAGHHTVSTHGAVRAGEILPHATSTRARDPTLRAQRARLFAARALPRAAAPLAVVRPALWALRSWRSFGAACARQGYAPALATRRSRPGPTARFC